MSNIQTGQPNTAAITYENPAKEALNVLNEIAKDKSQPLDLRIQAAAAILTYAKL